MSQITTCPACATAFRVVPDQLRLADGWVRCGECAEVFDARPSLQAWDDDAEAGAVDAASHPLRPTAGAEAEPVSDADHLAWELAEARNRPPDLLLDDPEPEEGSGCDPESEAQAEAQAGAGNPEEPGTSSAAGSGSEGELVAPSDPTEVADEPWPPEADPPPASAEARPQPDSAAEELSFLRNARPRADPWRRPAVRLLLGLFAAVLLLALGAQFAVHHRDRLAALHPPLAPALRALCAPLGCQLGQPRAIESIVIDSSTFARLRPDAFRLGVTLRNQALVPVEVPALELTLTDADDRAVLRRVLRPQELGAAPGMIPPGADWTASATVVVEANGLTARVAGYRLLAFYP